MLVRMKLVGFALGETKIPYAREGFRLSITSHLVELEIMQHLKAPYSRTNPREKQGHLYLGGIPQRLPLREETAELDDPCVLRRRPLRGSGRPDLGHGGQERIHLGKIEISGSVAAK